MCRAVTARLGTLRVVRAYLCMRADIEAHLGVLEVQPRWRNVQHLFGYTERATFLPIGNYW